MDQGHSRKRHSCPNHRKLADRVNRRKHDNHVNRHSLREHHALGDRLKPGEGLILCDRLNPVKLDYFVHRSGALAIH